MILLLIMIGYTLWLLYPKLVQMYNDPLSVIQLNTNHLRGFSLIEGGNGG